MLCETLTCFTHPTFYLLLQFMQVFVFIVCFLRTLVIGLLRGKVWSMESPLFEARSVSPEDQSLENILVQFRLTIGSTAKSSRLLGPFHALAFNPMKMKVWILFCAPNACQSVL